MQAEKVVLITGAAKRVGAVIARTLHAKGMRIVIHYRSSAKDAQTLCADLNQQRTNSAMALQADLLITTQLESLIQAAVNAWGQLDVLINNASTFYPTPIGDVTEENWHDLLGSNLKSPFFLSQAAAPSLAKQQGCIINIVDIYAKRPLKAYPVYCIAKAGLLMMTKVLAKELGPKVRVNAIAPGMVLSPEKETELDKAALNKIVAQAPLKRIGTPNDVANTAFFLIQHADYITGQVIAVDGGRSLSY